MWTNVCFFALANAVLATVCALGVWLLSRWVRRPAVLHLLWLLVLLRLVVPPVFLVNATGARDWFYSAVQSSSESTVAAARVTASRQLTLLALARETLQKRGMLPVRDLAPPVEDSAAVESMAAAATSPTWTALNVWWSDLKQSLFNVRGNLISLALLVWFSGSLLMLLMQLVQIVFFRVRLARIGYRSRVWQSRLEKVARRMGLRSCPEILLVRATVSPMLWGFGRRTCVLFPEQLLENLRVKAQNTLLAHELAHYRRGDQWVRLVEMFATVVFWWHPVTWWAIREIEQAEELCCDAWALKMADGTPRTYAEALLATVDFVSQSLPPAACGVSHRKLIAQRITAIMCERRVGNWFTPDAYPGMLALAACVLLPCPTLLTPSVPTTVLAPATMGLTTLAPARPPKAPSREPHPDQVAQNLEGDFVLVLSPDQRAVLRDPRGETEIGVGVLASASFARRDSTLAVGTLQGRVDLWDCESGRVVRQMDISHAPVATVAFSPDDSQLAVGTRDGLCKLIDLTDGHGEEIVRRERGSSVESVRFSPDGRQVAVLWKRRSQQRVELWDLVSGRVSAILRNQNQLCALKPLDSEQGWLLIREDGSALRWAGEREAEPWEGRWDDAQRRRLRIAPSVDPE